MVAALLLGFAGANATAQTYQAPTNQPRTDQAPGAKSDITRVQAGSDTSGVVSGQAKSGEPSMGAECISRLTSLDALEDDFLAIA
jgi:hypothetical protein